MADRDRAIRAGGGRRDRRRLVDAWERFVLPGRSGSADEPAPGDVRPEILTSWERSADWLTPDVEAAPLSDVDETRASWEASPLRAAVAQIEPQLRAAADDGELVVAVTDPAARILWTCEGTLMRRRAEGVNFVPGGRWDESSVGTNALDLALRLDRPATVFSAEHFTSCVHDWTCWAAPVHDPATGRQLGVLDLSTTWDRAHPLGTATATAFARLLEQAMAAGAGRPTSAGRRPAPPGSLTLRLLGKAEAYLDGVRLFVSRRQLEILALLALHPDGLSLTTLHAKLYGDRPVSLATLKAEVSHLRTMLGGALTSRIYRITVPVHCDASDVPRLLHTGRVQDAVAAYGGELLAGTDAPGLTEYGNYLAVAVREALLTQPDPQAVLRYAEAVPYDVEVLEHAVYALRGPSGAAALLRARLRTAYEY
jgi:GAF domain